MRLITNHLGFYGSIIWMNLFYFFFIYLFSEFFATMISCLKDDKKTIILSQINGFDICKFELPLEFEKLKKLG